MVQFDNNKSALLKVMVWHLPGSQPLHAWTSVDTRLDAMFCCCCCCLSLLFACYCFLFLFFFLFWGVGWGRGGLTIGNSTIGQTLHTYAHTHTHLHRANLLYENLLWYFSPRMANLKILLLFVATSCTQVIVNQHTEADTKWAPIDFADDISEWTFWHENWRVFYSNFMKISS